MKKMTAILLLLLLSLSITGCGSVIPPEHGQEEALYTVGNASIRGEVTSVDVSWSAGEVEILYDDTELVTVEETAKKPLTEAESMRWRLDGGNLTVKYCASGNLFWGSVSGKKLTLTLPVGCSLKKLSVDTASAEIRGEGLTADTLRLETASGDVDVSVAGALDMEVKTASGKAAVRCASALPELGIETASGNISCALAEVKALDVDTSSGKIGLSLSASEEAGFHSASGKMELRFGSAPKECKIDTASGDVTVSVPADAGFTVELDTASGDVESDLAMKMSGDTWVCGDGSAQWEIDTASGDVTFRAME